MSEQQAEPSKETQALNLLMKAAEKYIITLDDLARGPVAALLRDAITILANAITPKAAE